MIFNRRAGSSDPRPITEIAAAWALYDTNEISSKRQAERDAWRAASKENDDAYQAAMAALSELNRHAAQPAIMAIRNAALHARTGRRFGLRAVIAAGLLGMTLAMGLVAWWTSAHLFQSASAVARYSTEIGERSTIALPDGSEMLLNTASTVEVSFSESQREIHLLKGQALFTVAHGRPAPFRVYAADRMITAVGTAFDVRLDGQRVRVTMLEGRVRVGPASGRVSANRIAREETLSAGETMLASPQEPARIKAADVERATSWRSGLLTFQDTPLSEAIAEVNRYTDRPLTLADDVARRYTISGTFRTGEPDRFARTMTQLFPLDLAFLPQGTLQLKRRAAERPVIKN